MSEVWSNWVKRIEVLGIRIQKTNLWIWAQVEIKHASGASCHLGKVIKNLEIYKKKCSLELSCRWQFILINVNWIRNIKSQSKKMGANKSQCVMLHICLVRWAALCLRLSGKNRQISYLSSRNAALIFCCCKKKIT